MEDSGYCYYEIEYTTPYHNKDNKGHCTISKIEISTKDVAVSFGSGTPHIEKTLSMHRKELNNANVIKKVFRIASRKDNGTSYKYDRYIFGDKKIKHMK